MICTPQEAINSSYALKMSLNLSSPQEPKIMYEGLSSTKEKKEAIMAELRRLNKAEEVEKALVILLEERDAAAAAFAEKITYLQESLLSTLCGPLVLSSPPAPPCSPVATLPSSPRPEALAVPKMKKNGEMETLAEAAARQKKNAQNYAWLAKNPEKKKQYAKKYAEKKKSSRGSPSSLAASPSTA